MGLMFPRVAHNFIKNGYYPTDQGTLDRVMARLDASGEYPVRLFDPCAGEGAAIDSVAHHLGRDRSEVYAVEYNRERADYVASLADMSLHSDFMDVIVSQRSFGLLWLNPPYGDLVADHSGASVYRGKGRRRLEKLFYQRAIGTLQPGGVLVFIIPTTALDDEIIHWVTSHCTQISFFEAAVDTYKQVVIMGVKIRSSDRERFNEQRKKDRAHLQAFMNGDEVADMLHDVAGASMTQYSIPKASAQRVVFYKAVLDGHQLLTDIQRCKGNWFNFSGEFHRTGLTQRRPMKSLTPWHLALSLAAGAISGVVKSDNGSCYVVKGDTHKEKSSKTEFTEQEDGSISEVRVMTDKFVPVILGWDMTAGENLGALVVISSTAASSEQNEQDETVEEPLADYPAPVVESQQALELGQLVMTQGVKHFVKQGFSPIRYIARHRSGDWGDLCEHDQEVNRQALIHGDRIMSVYKLNEPIGTLWVITEADRSVTTLLLPSEY